MLGQHSSRRQEESGLNQGGAGIELTGTDSNELLRHEVAEQSGILTPPAARLPDRRGWRGGRGSECPAARSRG